MPYTTSCQYGPTENGRMKDYARQLIFLMHDDVMGLQNETDQTMQDKLEWLEDLILSH